MNKILILSLVTLLLLGVVSATTINYYYHPGCSHCNSVSSFIESVKNKYINVKFNMLDVSKGSYNIKGIPTLELYTNDNRKIDLVGSQEIPRYLICELNEQSNLNCPTYSANECRNTSWFVK